jgi:hypothetical protein
VHAGEADVLAVEVSAVGEHALRFDVTVRHADSGWDHDADAFEVVAPDGAVLGTRTLLHPHVDEQPFTRELTSVTVPDGITEVIDRAHDRVHGWGGDRLRVALPLDQVRPLRRPFRRDPGRRSGAASVRLVSAPA